MRKTLEERFWEKVQIGNPGDCWLWIGGRSGKYGVIRTHRTTRAHRVSWILAHGEIPEGLCVCHKCDVPLCVNPAHLFLATIAENTADSVRKGRRASPVGSLNSQSKLIESQAREILRRHAAGETQRALAIEFGIDPSTVWKIVHYKAWKHVEMKGV